MQLQLKRVRRLFTVTIIGLCVASMLSLLTVLYWTSTVSFGQQTSPGQLQSLTANSPAVSKYLQEQKASEAHWISLAGLIKNDQQKSLARAALVSALPLVLASALLGYLLARFLLRPVALAYESQERFLQDAAHELRNPLATMSAVLQQARSKLSIDDKVKSTFEVLDRQTDHMVRINEDLLFLERTQKRDAPKIDAAELLRDVADTLQPLANKKKAKLVIKTVPAQMAIHPDDFVSLARNLIDNAIKYSPDDKPSRIKVSLERGNRGVTLRVADQGIGIPAAELPHIGERFYRASNVARRDGSGLGFAIIRKVANDYNAQVDIDSKPDSGTAVSVSFRS
ncbi:MAG TPA: HAMP domain-containing sensor histidine kinase [Candidatus Saccharimonadales bacterium]|jgi:OmpR-family two-component system manganese-sensing sensor histidine kinase